MNQILQQTDEEKLAMYMKLSKKELSLMLIESNKHIERLIASLNYVSQPIITGSSDNWGNDHFNHCACNPKNGGSGICNCTLGGMKITFSNP